MKNIIVLLTFVLPFLLASCSSDDPVSPKITAPPDTTTVDSSGNSQSLYLDEESEFFINKTTPSDSNLTIMVWMNIEDAEPNLNKRKYIFDYAVWSDYGNGSWYSQMKILTSKRPEYGDSTRFIFDANFLYNVSEKNLPYMQVINNEWVHFAIVINSESNTITVYVNGETIFEQEVSSRKGIEPLTREKKRLSFGKEARLETYPQNPETAIKGLFSNIAIYDRALTKEEITERMKRKVQSGNDLLMGFTFDGSTTDVSDETLEGTILRGRYSDSVPF